MPDTSGWPTEAETIKRLEVVSPDVLQADILGQVGFILAGVIAEFQSPQSRNGGGGTGRNFTPFIETRTYSGHGYPSLYLGDDIVPGTTPTVTVFGSATPLTSVLLQETKRGLGYNTLVIQSSGYYPITGPVSGGFPVGLKNISVLATWGYAATVPYDINQAIMGETIYRVLTSFAVDMAGIGVEIQIGQNKINTAAGVSVWAVSSPLGVMHGQYCKAIERYRTSNAAKLKAFTVRMA
jgi:hypothetical protein